MFSRCKTIFNKTREVLASTATSYLEMYLGKAAGLGGFILSLPLFAGAKIETSSRIMIASLSPAMSFIVFSVSDYLKSFYVDKFKSDKQWVDTILVDLQKTKFDSVLVENDLKGSYQKIIELLPKDTGNISPIPIYDGMENQIIYDAELNNKLKKVIEKILQCETNFDKFIKYLTAVIAASGGFVGGASAVFINFIIPMVLKSEFENNEINSSARAVAGLLGLFFMFSGLARFDKELKNLSDEKARLGKAIDDLCQLYSEVAQKNDKLLANPEFIRLWKEKEIPRDSSQEVELNDITYNGMKS